MQDKKELRDNVEYCPNCNANLQGSPIPKDQQHLFGATHFGRKIGIEDPMVYDGVSWWGCPDCNHVWKRFPWSPEYKGEFKYEKRR